jgi:menaquinone-dependent protoporphyrinogen IX oxidase
MAEARRFLRENSSALAARPLGIFTLGITLDVQAGRDFTDVVLAELARHSGHVSPATAAFGGVINLNKMSYLERIVLRAGFSMQDEDQRDMRRVRAWAEEFAHSLQQS